MTARNDVWQPSPHHMESSNIALLMKRLGFGHYDALYAYSVQDPAGYWNAVNDFCGIVWSRPYAGYVDCARGPAFPQWFPGGELNWTDTVLAWADKPETARQAAIIAERENGACEVVSYADLKQKVRSLAAGLARRGVVRGDRVGLLMENGIEANVTWLALSYMGAIVVPLFTGFGVDAIVARLASCKARALIATTGFSRRGHFVDARQPVEAARQQLPTVEFIAWKASPEGPPLQAGELAWADLAAEPVNSEAPAARMAPDDPFMVIYTSGTTGKPKGPVHTHGGFPLKIAHDAAVHFDISQGDVLCWPADMGWIAGSLVSASAFMRGATLVTYDGAPDFPDWSRMSRLIERHKVTHYGSSPTLIRGLAANEEQALKGDLATIALLITAGESIDPEHFAWFQRKFGRGTCPVINYTGGTEVSGGLLSSVVVKPIARSAFNTPSPAIALDAVDSTGKPVRGEVGELAILQPFVGMTKSFWQDDERYLDTYWSAVPGIWIHGDLALRDEHDNFYILGRSDDTIKVAGKRLGPGEVEEILLELPDIREVAAIGVPDPVKGQKLVVVVTASAGWSGDPEQLRSAVQRHVEVRMGKPFRPSQVYLVEQLPKTRSSKVMRRVVRNIYADLPLGDLSALDNPAAIDELRRVMEKTS
nr:AMP-binding protein [Pseudomonas sp.]